MKSRYRLLITISEFMYSSQVRNLCDLVSFLDKDRFSIEIGALQTGNEASGEIEKLGVPYHKFRLQPTRPLRTRDMLAFAKSPIRLLARRYDIVHSLLYQSIFTEALFSKILGGTKYVYTKSNLDWDNHPLNWRIKSSLADQIISISGATDSLLEEKGFKNKARKIYLGIDTDHFKADLKSRKDLRKSLNISESATVFGCAAQFVRWKDHLTAIKAFEHIADEDPNTFLLMCGPHHNDGYYREILERVQSSKHVERIKLLGTLSDMPAFYSAIDCFVLPSHYETFGYVYIEAMSCERPVIGCRAAGPLEIIEEGKTGAFIEIEDVHGLVAEMRKYLQDEKRLHQHGKAARKRAVALFSKAKMAAECQNLYLELLENDRQNNTTRK